MFFSLMTLKSVSGSSLCKVTTPHLVPIMTGSAVKAECKTLGWHMESVSMRSPSKESHQGAPWGSSEEDSVGFYLEPDGHGAQVKRMTFKFLQCSLKDFRYLLYLPFECVSHMPLTDASHHTPHSKPQLRRHVHEHITVPGFQVSETLISVLGLDIPPASGLCKASNPTRYALASLPRSLCPQKGRTEVGRGINQNQQEKDTCWQVLPLLCSDGSTKEEKGEQAKGRQGGQKEIQVRVSGFALHRGHKGILPMPQSLQVWEPLQICAPSNLEKIMLHTFSMPRVLCYPLLVFFNSTHTFATSAFIRFPFILSVSSISSQDPNRYINLL